MKDVEKSAREDALSEHDKMQKKLEAEEKEKAERLRKWEKVMGNKSESNDSSGEDDLGHLELENKE